MRRLGGCRDRRQRYADFGPSLAVEVLLEGEHGQQLEFVPVRIEQPVLLDEVIGNARDLFLDEDDVVVGFDLGSLAVAELRLDADFRSQKSQ